MIPGQLFSPTRPDVHQTTHQAVIEENSSSSEDGESGDEARELPALCDSTQQTRSLSSMSSRYRTPAAGTIATSPPPVVRLASVPAMQPMPAFETESAFSGHQSAPIPPSSAYPSSPYSGTYQQSVPAPQIHSALPLRGGRSYGAEVLLRSASRPPLEQAVENVQTHLAALTERLDALESQMVHQQRSISLPLRGSSGRCSPAHNLPVALEWDLDDMGLWSFVLRPLSQMAGSLKQLLIFFARSEDRSPLLTIVRRLCLDISFSLAVLGLLRMTWKKTATRRREVNAALVLLWAALSGRNKGRPMISRGV